MKDEIKKRIEESMMMTGGNTPEEKAFWKQGAEFGVSLMQEEVDRLIRALNTNTEDINNLWEGNFQVLEHNHKVDIEEKDQTIESQAKEIEELETKYKNVVEDRHSFVTEIGKKIESKDKEISQLKEALREVHKTGKRYYDIKSNLGLGQYVGGHVSGDFKKALSTIDTLLTDKELKPMKK